MVRRYGAGLGAAVLAMGLTACQSDTTGRAAAEQAALAAGYPFGTHLDCDGTVARELQVRGIAPGAVDNIWYQDERALDLDDDDRVLGYLAYVRLVDQLGLLVVDLTPQCFVRQVYTRDGLELPGIPAF